MPSKLVLRPSLPPSAKNAPGHAKHDNSAWRALRREEILDPQRPIIDAHHHLWAKAGETYALEDYLADTRAGHDIRASVYVECGSNYRTDGPEMMNRLGEIEFAQEQAMKAAAMPRDTRVCAAIVGTADLTYGAEIARLLDAEIAASPDRVRGIRLSTKWDPDEALNHGRYVVPPRLLMDESFREGYALLAPRNLSFDALVYHPQIPELAHLARSFPDTQIILNHIGGLVANTRTYRDHADQAVAQWRTAMAELARCPNVMVKLGGLGMAYVDYGLHSLATPASSQELARIWGPLLEFCIDQFGPDRCMFESNFPPDRDSVDFHVMWNAFKRIASGYSEDEKHELFFGTAARAYRLKLDPP
ncbi:amidohydrolase family protein [Bordetella petrii]|nr:amidohydrolase family protein [Bordetella petrii]